MASALRLLRLRLRLRLRLLLVGVALCLSVWQTRAEQLAVAGDNDDEADARYYHEHHLHDRAHSVQDPASLYYYYSPADIGCALCRNAENCSIAFRNRSDGVFCGDVLTTLRPCCCAFRNECITTIFSDTCECFDAEQEEQLLNTRFYLFVVLTAVAWVLLVYDKMCAGPYKVMNSNHQALASTPSAAAGRTVPTAAEDEDDSDRETMDAVGEADTLRLRGADQGGSDASPSPTTRRAPSSDEMDRIEVSVVDAASPPSSPTRRSAARASREGDPSGSSLQSV
jgi:hypothetical protein